MTDFTLPTARMRIIDPANAMEEMRAFGEGLLADGKRAWFEVRWPRPEGHWKTQEEWDRDQEETFDAVELMNGELFTLPPYADLLGVEKYEPEEGFGQ